MYSPLNSYVYIHWILDFKIYNYYYGKLFRILLSKKLPILFIRLVLDSYLRQSVCVMGDSYKSEYFKIV